ncbi:threonine/serine dehydratase [Marivita hallyeonensis]|uniref:Threonine dehydratase n=1 Tax=Marivita hallyeonensis TaxID=996342 RepID=A0A1M5USH3_9RHOB|nr:threonine/serine dehydratase [Marivita hallyeonensis]SHH65895.1 threonine dehydratase [Marivita hallyeonensis]
MDWQAEIEAAAARVRDHVVQTPVMTTDAFGRRIEMKLEQVQHTGSFKARGAFNTLLASDVPEAGVVAASGGNHGAAVAFAARHLGHRTKIFVPEIAGPAKIALIERTGAALTVVPGEYANALELAEREAAESGAMQIHAYDAPLTVAGQGTMVREWEAQGLEADTVLIAVGGGGLIAGALGWLKRRRKVVAVEPMTACALHAALEAGEPIDVPVSGIAANALGARRIGGICFELATEIGIEVVRVTDGAIAEAQTALWQAHRQLVEPAGAAALAALMSGAYVPAPGERVAVLVCGGNIAPDPL